MNRILQKTAAAAAAFAVCVSCLYGCGKNDYSAAYNAYDRTGERYDYDLSEYVELSRYKEIVIPKITFAVTDEKLDQEMMRKMAYYVPWEDGEDNVSEKGDIVAMTCTCYIGDQIYSDLTKASSYSIVAGGGVHDVPELDEALIGVKAGDEKTIEFDFPDPYFQNVSISGEHAKLEIKVLDVDDLLYPDDWTEIISKYYGFSSVEEMEEDTRTSLVEQYAKYLYNYEVPLVWKYVCDNSKVKDYPEAEYNEAYDSYINMYQKNADADGITLEEYILNAGDTVEAFKDHVDEMAKQDVLEEMLLYYIARCENITVSDEEYKEAVMDYASDYDISDEDTAVKMVEQSYGADAFREMVRMNKVYDFLGKSAVVDETKTTVKQVD